MNRTVLITGSSGLIGSEAVVARSITEKFEHFNLDIRNGATMLAFFKENRPDVVIHCAAQPSHDLAKDRPCDDFDVNEHERRFLRKLPRRLE